jgi:SAM-dependent methyltransferase
MDRPSWARGCRAAGRRSAAARARLVRGAQERGAEQAREPGRPRAPRATSRQRGLLHGIRRRRDAEQPGQRGRDLQRLIGELAPGAAVVDLGCGNGWPVAAALSRAGLAVTGVDVSAEQVSRAMARVPDGRFVVADMTSVDFPAGAFAGAVAWDSIFHLPPAEHAGLWRARARGVPGRARGRGLQDCRPRGRRSGRSRSPRGPHPGVRRLRARRLSGAGALQGWPEQARARAGPAPRSTEAGLRRRAGGCAGRLKHITPPPRPMSSYPSAPARLRVLSNVPSVTEAMQRCSQLGYVAPAGRAGMEYSPLRVPVPYALELHPVAKARGQDHHGKNRDHRSHGVI